ncbi:MAG: diaminopropionate ammonia-lyase [Gemmatimonadota bacterium]|nr:diaminopropionate ammonia-lyase [Gemmatimonadota bacterium]
MTLSEGANLPDASGLAKPIRVSLRGSSGPRPVWGPAESIVLGPGRAAAARAELELWPGYAPTPLVSLPGLADRLGVAEVRCKDESGRFGIGSFKALGGAHAVLRVLQDELRGRTGTTPDPREMHTGRVSVADITTTTASAGNHGRSVAWGSELFGCECVVVLPEGAVPARAEAIESHGARVEWFPGEYDAAVGYVEAQAREQGWLVVSDTAYDGYETVPRWVYEGYTLLAHEALEQLAESSSGLPTHLFIQAGVGGLATGVCGHLWYELGPNRPSCVAVEPLSADCFGRSIRAGRVTTVEGPFGTHMGGLAAGVPSTLSWNLLGGCLDAGVAISDDASDAAAAALATGELGETITAGPSGAAGVGALLALARLPSTRALLGLTAASRVLVLVTETKF